MNKIYLECLVEEKCEFITRPSYVPTVALEMLDEHLQEEHNTTFKEEWETNREEILERLQETDINLEQEGATEIITEFFDEYAST